MVVTAGSSGDEQGRGPEFSLGYICLPKQQIHTEDWLCTGTRPGLGDKTVSERGGGGSWVMRKSKARRRTHNEASPAGETEGTVGSGTPG